MVIYAESGTNEPSSNFTQSFCIDFHTKAHGECINPYLPVPTSYRLNIWVEWVVTRKTLNSKWWRRLDETTSPSFLPKLRQITENKKEAMENRDRLRPERA